MQQLVFNFPEIQEFNTDDFFVTKENRLAYEVIVNSQELWNVEPYKNSLIISGPAGCGKTHLTHIWAKKTNAVFLNPINEFSIDSKHNCYILENIENKNWDEEKVLYIFNILNETGKYLLITSGVGPNFLDFKIKDLKSRINSLMHIKIEYPSDNLVQIMLSKYFSSRGLQVPIEVINFLLTNIARDFKVLIQIVRILDEACMSSQKKLTIPFAKKVLKDFVPNSLEKNDQRAHNQIIKA